MNATVENMRFAYPFPAQSYDEIFVAKYVIDFASFHC